MHDMNLNRYPYNIHLVRTGKTQVAPDASTPVVLPPGVFISMSIKTHSLIVALSTGLSPRVEVLD